MPRPPPLASRYAGPDDSPGFLVWQAANLWQRRQRAALAPLDLTHVQLMLLSGAAWLARAGGPPTQARLAAHARTDPMMTSKVVRALEARGLLRREEDPADTRAWRLVVTPAGRELAERAMALAEAADAAFFAPLGDRAPSFMRALRGLIQAPPVAAAGAVAASAMAASAAASAQGAVAAPGDLFAAATRGSQLNHWFRDHASAARHLASHGGWLFPWRHQFFVGGDEAVLALGLSLDDADLALVGRDLARPGDPAAYARLAGRIG